SLVRCDSQSETACRLSILDLHVTVTNHKQLRSVQIVLCEYPLDDHLFGEVLIPVERGIDVRSEVMCNLKSFRLILDVFQVSAARQVEGNTALAQGLEECPRAPEEQFIRLYLPRLKSRDTVLDPLPEPGQVFVFVIQWFPRSAPALPDFFHQLKALV